MKIQNPVLVPDVSLWVSQLRPKEFEDGGCKSVIVGLYFVTDPKSGKLVFNPVSRAQCQAVVRQTDLLLQAYYWVDPTLPAADQAARVNNLLGSEGLPIRFLWADLEQWWSRWDLWYQARANKIPMLSVPACPALALSRHFETFLACIQSPNKGVYTNRGFVTSWAPDMNRWLPKYPQWVAQYGREPNVVTKLTWAQLKPWLPDYDLALSAGQLPHQVVGHQFTGDIFKLPGAYDAYDGKIPFYDGRLPLDVSVFDGAWLEFLRTGKPVAVPDEPVPPAPIVARYQVVQNRNPNVWTTSSVWTRKWAGLIYAGWKLTVDIETPQNGYVHFADNSQGGPSNGWVWAQFLVKIS